MAGTEQEARLLGAAIDSRLGFSLGQMQRFRDQQEGVYEDGVSTTRIDLARSSAARSYNDDGEFHRNLYVANAELTHRFTRHEADPVTVAKARASQTSQFWRERGESALANDDLPGAQRYFAQGQALMTPGDRAASAARLQDATVNHAALQETRRILSLPVSGAAPVAGSAAGTSAAGDAGQTDAGQDDRGQGDTTPAGTRLQGPASGGRIAALDKGPQDTEPRPPDLATRLAAADQIADPEVRERAKLNLTAATAQETAAYRADQHQRKATAKQVLDDGKGYSDIPYDVLNGMDRAGRDALVAYARAGGKVTTDPVAFYRLQDLALDHPQAFLDADLNDHIDKLDGQDLARLTALQATLREKGPADPQFSLQRVNGQGTDMMLNLLGLPIRLTGAAKADSPAGNSDLDRQAAAFKRDIAQRAAAQEAVTGRKITPEEYQKLLVEMMVEQGAALQALHPVNDNGPVKPADTSNEYDDLVRCMTTKGWVGKPVDVVIMPDGEITSLDNTRIKAATAAGTDVQAIVHKPSEKLTPQEIGRFSYRDKRSGKRFELSTWGEAVSGRIARQKGDFPSQYPNGSWNEPELTRRQK